jgi:hypothetical protein
VKYRLLIELEVYDFVSTLSARTRRVLRDRFDRILQDPTGCTDYYEKDETGRVLNVHAFRGWAIKFWDDFPDRHIKIFRIIAADR